jgi:glutaredoxin
MRWRWLRWLTGRRAEHHQSPIVVLMYTRAGCHLCDDAWRELEAVRERYALELSNIDVDSDPALREQYGLEVPVVVVNGRVRFRGRVNRVLLERLLEGERRFEKGS